MLNKIKILFFIDFFVDQTWSENYCYKEAPDQ